MNQVVIMRGPSGAGKSSWIEREYPNREVCSADDHFMVPNTEVDGLAAHKLVYRFDAAKLDEAHLSCMRRFLRATDLDPDGGDGNDNVVVVDNTNVRYWEFAGYVQVARARGFQVRVVRLDVPPDMIGEAARRNKHGVPKAIVRNMVKGMERPPRWLTEEVVPWQK